MRILREVLSSKGVIDFILHEYFNKEYWRSHIQMKRADARTMATNLCCIHKLLKNDPVCKEYWSNEMDTYFHKFISKAERGWYEDLDRYLIYQLKGYDADGLPMYYRNGGTSCLECFHQKLDTLAGPWASGVRIGHYTMLLRSTRFNINTGITRNSEPNFGHPYLHFSDRFQHWVYEIWGVVILPRHQNGLDFKPTNFVGVGIGPNAPGSIICLTWTSITRHVTRC
jgi:hypothetical protein